ncbi:MAG: trehalose-phosphatase [Actinobacteria bacterium]|nr:trehalose-phosphatase [Actinomycetota bacterium]
MTNSPGQLPPQRHAGDAATYTVGCASKVDGASHDPSRLEPGLRLALRDIARTSTLLIGCDYDGTLSPIVSNPAHARPLPGTDTILRQLANLQSTAVALVSGRALRDLAALSRLPAEITLVGSHGAEFTLDSNTDLSQAAIDRLVKLVEQCSSVIDGVDGTQLENKPGGVAVHVRNADRTDASRVLVELHELFDDDADVKVTRGKEVLEMSVTKADKGSAMDRLRVENEATAVIFIGDDVTDEYVFQRLTGEPHLTVKVGHGDTAARFRVDEPHDVLEVLAVLGEERELWLAGANATPIEDHAMLADGTDVALLTPAGSINWLCHPGPDAPAIFAALLGDSEAGQLAISPAHEGRPLSQKYIDHTMTVVTNWSGVNVTDYLDSSYRRVPGRETELRLMRVISGRTPVTLTFSPRPQFGAVPTGLRVTDQGIRVTGTSDYLVLVAPGLDWTITHVGPHPTATATIDPSDGDVVVELRAGTDDMTTGDLSELERRSRTHGRWRDFSDKLITTEKYEQVVRRSALTLKALCHEPTGAALAAATTSLPEWVGGIRNWDYRYCWLRDAAMTVGALSLLGSTDEADAFMVWLKRVMVTVGRPDRVHPLYSLEGHILGPEAVVDTLPGYAGSRPVRIGNAAQGQVQLDVFGPICEMVAVTAAERGSVTELDLLTVRSCVEAVSRRWHEADHGIWEIRDTPRFHVHSRVMCWMAIDQAIHVVELSGGSEPTWKALRSEIAQDIFENGWDGGLNSFVSAYGRQDVDAAVLAVITSGLIEGTDPRAIGTIQAVEASLRDGPTVYRYRHDDGLPGTEGGMNICTSWLIEAYVAAGMLDDAHNLFEQLLDCSGLTDLLPEMYDPGSDHGLGNHPQAYSHLGVIRCALVLEQADEQASMDAMREAG